MKPFLILLSFGAIALTIANASHQLENLGRGLIVHRVSDDEAFLSWRLLATDSGSIAFNVYRSTGDNPPLKINGAPIADSTSFTDFESDFSQEQAYYVRAIQNGVSQVLSKPFNLSPNAPIRQYSEIPLRKPDGGVTPTGESYEYSANDCSVADLDNDGEYEIVVKWDPSNSHDNSHDGYTGNVYLDAYEFDGTRLWRIDLGVNIRAGAHYTQFMVYDLDGDGIAEVACKTADGTTSGTGQLIGDGDADHRNSAGRILSGPEFFTIFDGQTGAELTTIDYEVERGNVNDWGDGYGNRIDRFNACIAYLDGERPSIVMCRGYYTRTALVAYDWRDGELTRRWIFDTGHSTTGELAPYRGQGAHSLTVGDVDADGRDEIVFGACTIDDDGTGLYSTTLGHGDALHLSDMDPSRPGMEVWMVHESPSEYGEHGSELHDAATGEIIYSLSGEGSDVGRGASADIDPRYLGYETWASRGGLSNVDGTLITGRTPSAKNFLCYWDGDLLRECLDGIAITKWDWENETLVPLLQASGCLSNNGTKATPALCADIYGDWREEVIWRDETSENLRIYSTTIPTENRITTLMHDRQYRLAIAWQNVGYNQPPHPSFYLGEGMTIPDAPDAYMVGNGPSPNMIPVNERFAVWLEEKGLPSNSDPDLDHDLNGTTLRTEYAFDIAIDTPQSPIDIEPVNGFVSNIRIDTPRDEFDYALETSKNLVEWTLLQTIPGVQESVQFETEINPDPCFYRVAVNKTEDYNSHPITTVTNPEQNDQYEAGASVSFKATAEDSDGTIVSIEFQRDGETINIDSEAPFQFDWTATGDGQHEVRAIATDNEGAKGYSSKIIFWVIDSTATGGTTYPAETATAENGFQETTNSGFNGSGYFNFDTNGSYLEFTEIDGGSGGSAILSIRYALGAELSRSGSLSINGATQSISFSATGAWTIWQEQELNITLNAGANNTIRIASNGEDLANIDEITIELAD